MTGRHVALAATNVPLTPIYDGLRWDRFLEDTYSGFEILFHLPRRDPYADVPAAFRRRVDPRPALDRQLAARWPSSTSSHVTP